MRRGTRLPMEKLTPYLFETATFHSTKSERSLPSPPYSRERGEGAKPPRAAPPHPQPLAPEYGGEGREKPPAPADSSEPTLPVEWRQVFGNPNPVEIEVGFGKGLFLVNSAQARPATNFFGIEIERKYTLFTATRIAKRALHNVRLATADARLFFTDQVRTASVSALHVYFPDPWWKNRHRKRRLFTEEFAVQCERVLVPGGMLHFVSDVEAYFEETALMLGRLQELRALPRPETSDAQHAMDYLTNFERKYRLAGKPIYRGQWTKLE